MMKKQLFKIFFLFSLFLMQNGFSQSKQEKERWDKLSENTTIYRDNWGIAHIYGNTDKDAVFGMLYAQCEDDFQRVEMNYIEKLGRLSEIKGKTFLYQDLETRILIDQEDAKKDYQKAQPWLKELLQSYADGINFYLHKNPQVKPLLIKKFEPWFPLLWTDGSIGAINTADLTTKDLSLCYPIDQKTSYVFKEKDMQTGSNGFAIGPKKSLSGNSLLFINPHTTFYFRPEIHIKSKQGLNAYGAVTWGQFFVYQGFNENLGWMHTSSNVDVADMYAEKVRNISGKWEYFYENQWKKVGKKEIEILYKEEGKIYKQKFETYFTHHGPIMGKVDEENWISLKHQNRSMSSLAQSWLRTKAVDFKTFEKTMDIRANTSNNTVYADDKGNISYWHGNFIPKRNPQYNWGMVVDGTTKETEWKGLHNVKETVFLKNPENAWLQNCNSTPFSVSGNQSPKKSDFLPYMAPDGENFRGVNANRIFGNAKKYDLDLLIQDAYDTYLAIFPVLLPALFQDYQNNQELHNPEMDLVIESLKKWDYYSSENSIAATLAIEWAFKLDPILKKVYINQGEKDQIENTNDFVKNAKSKSLVTPLFEVVNELKSKFGKWQVAWGEINRFQRNSSNIDLIYDDNQASLPIGYASGLWGCLPSYKSDYQKNTNKRYGYNGNSFVCAVEFGPKVKAKSLLAGGNSGDMQSKHFDDQSEMYRNAKFKDVYFYDDEILAHTEKKYHPGQN